VTTPGVGEHEISRLEANIHGRVQGVGFRYFVRQEATELGVSGWVSNQPDGSVRVVAEGSHGALEDLLGVLEAGPRGARVDRVDAHWSDARGDVRGFGVRPSGHSGD
jgi:acylphosphatase